MTQRHIGFQGAVNFRDIGGYGAGPGRQTRWRRIYRSDSLADLTAADIDRLAGLGLYGLADFRLPGERARKPDRLPPGHALRVLTPGFIPAGTEDMLARLTAGRIGAEEIRAEVTQHYTLFAADHLGDYTSTLGLILQADGRPVLLHCTSGKDRTGFGVALLLLIAGVDEATITADYALTNDYRRDIGFMFPGPVDPAAVAMLTAARPEYLQTALASLRQTRGTPDDWLADLGFDAADRARLRELLTEPAA